MNVAKRIKITRDHFNITRKELADHLGITPQSLAQKESGTRKITVEEIKIISEFMNIHPVYLAFYACDTSDELVTAIDSKPVEILSSISSDEEIATQ